MKAHANAIKDEEVKKTREQNTGYLKKRLPQREYSMQKRASAMKKMAIVVIRMSSRKKEIRFARLKKKGRKKDTASK